MTYVIVIYEKCSEKCAHVLENIKNKAKEKRPACQFINYM